MQCNDLKLNVGTEFIMHTILKAVKWSLLPQEHFKGSYSINEKGSASIHWIFSQIRVQNLPQKTARVVPIGYENEVEIILYWSMQVEYGSDFGTERKEIKLVCIWNV